MVINLSAPGALSTWHNLNSLRLPTLSIQESPKELLQSTLPDPSASRGMAQRWGAPARNGRQQQ
jgi:hypothetical protein